MAKILIEPDSLLQWSNEFKTVSRQIQEINSRVTGALNNLNWETTIRKTVDSNWKIHSKQGNQHAQEILELSKYLEKVSKDFSTLDQQSRSMAFSPVLVNIISGIGAIGLGRLPSLKFPIQSVSVQMGAVSNSKPVTSNPSSIKEIFKEELRKHEEKKKNSTLKTEYHIKEPGAYTYLKNYDTKTGAYTQFGHVEGDFSLKETTDRSGINGIGGGGQVKIIEAGWDTKVIDSNVQVGSAELEARISTGGGKIGGEASLAKYEAKTEPFRFFGYDINFGGSVSAGVGGNAEINWNNGLKFGFHGALGLGAGFSFEIKKGK
jgi:uncharacterized protein YukE